MILENTVQCSWLPTLDECVDAGGRPDHHLRGRADPGHARGDPEPRGAAAAGAAQEVHHRVPGRVPSETPGHPLRVPAALLRVNLQLHQVLHEGEVEEEGEHNTCMQVNMMVRYV